MKRKIIYGLTAIALLFAVAACSDNGTELPVEPETEDPKPEVGTTEYAIAIDPQISNGTIEATVAGETTTKAFDNQEVVLTATPATGYSFVRWRSEGVVLPNAHYNPATLYMPESDITVSADFALTDYTFTMQSLGGESYLYVTSEGKPLEGTEEGGVRIVKATMGTVLDLEAYASYDNEFLQWMALTQVEVDGQLVDTVFDLPDPTSNPLQLTMPASDIYVLAQFKPKDLQAGAMFTSGVKWAYLNVDAPGTFTATPEEPGMFYQWNRATGWSVEDPITSSDGSAWNDTEDQSTVWTDENNPCPTGWRLPTGDELATLLDPRYTKQIMMRGNDGILSGVIYVCQFTKNFIYLPTPGNRDNMGTLWNAYSEVAQYGTYISSTLSEFGAVANLNIAPGNSLIEDMWLSRAYAGSVRCVEDPGDDGGGPIIIIPPGDGGGDIF